jgi:hypothetical protein
MMAGARLPRTEFMMLRSSAQATERPTGPRGYAP